MTDKTGMDKLLALLENRLVAFPVGLTNLEKAAELGLKLSKPNPVTVEVAGFSIDAYIFTCDHQEEIALIQVIGYFVEMTGKKDPAYRQCTWKAKLLPLFVEKDGTAVIHNDPKQSDEDKDKEHVALQKYHKVLCELSKITGGLKFYFHCDGGFIRTPFTPEPNVIHIFNNASPPGETSTRYVRKAFGLALHREGMAVLSAGPTSGRGKVFTDEKESLVQIIGNNIYLLLPTISYYTETESTELFERTLTLAWNSYRENLNKMEIPRPINKENFVEVLSSAETEGQKYTDEEIEKVNTELERLRQALLIQYRRRQSLIRIISDRASRNKETETMFLLEFQKIKAEPDVANIYFADKGVHVKTNPVFMEYEGEKYSLGSFIIRISSWGEISIWNEQPTHPDGVPHPHIAKNGGPCFGNATDAITKAAANYKYADAIHYVLRWLTRGYSPESAEVPIEQWPVAIDDFGKIKATVVRSKSKKLRTKQRSAR